MEWNRCNSTTKQHRNTSLITLATNRMNPQVIHRTRNRCTHRMTRMVWTSLHCQAVWLSPRFLKIYSLINKWKSVRYLRHLLRISADSISFSGWIRTTISCSWLSNHCTLSQVLPTCAHHFHIVPHRYPSTFTSSRLRLSRSSDEDLFCIRKFD